MGKAHSNGGVFPAGDFCGCIKRLEPVFLKDGLAFRRLHEIHPAADRLAMGDRRRGPIKYWARAL